jgi:hypothetical protein
MHEFIYEPMVEAGVAIKLDKEVMMDIDGNKTLDTMEEKQSINLQGQSSAYLSTRLVVLLT